MKTWKKVMFVVVLVSFIGLSVFFTFFSIARDTYEFEQQTDVGGVEGLDGWVFYGFNGSTATEEVYVDFVRDQSGANPDSSKPVVGVDEFTIVSDEYVEYIHIGKDVRYISDKAFYYCKKLKAVFVDEENPFFVSVDGCLYTKDMQTLVLHPILNGEWQVEQSLSETKDTYDIPQGVVNIGAFSFYKNTDLVHLSFPDTVKTIGDMAFFGCNNMWTVWLPQNLESIGADAFSYCWSMSPLMYIPSSVKEIGHHAFFSCSSLSVFYMGADSEQSMSLGESWLPDSIKRGPLNTAPKPVYGKTLEQALEEKERIDSANAKE